MTFFAIFFALVAIVIAGPVKIEDNNVGDIISVNLEGSIDISNKQDQTIVSVILALLNQELAVISVDEEGRPEAPNFPWSSQITSEKVKPTLNQQK